MKVLSTRLRAALLLLLVSAFGCAPTATMAAEPMRIGTKEAPPFAMKSEDGAWTGISVDLWRMIADDMGLAYEFQEFDLPGMLAGVADGTLDAAVAAITVTPDRERSVDFTHPFYTTGLGIAQLTEQRVSWPAVLRHFMQENFWQFARVVGLLLLGLMTVGALLWLFERRANKEQFHGSFVKGLGDAFWWAAVTMTTVGYGDKAPRSFAGRAIATVWMFAAIILISSFTAAITSALTIGQMTPKVRGPGDLPFVRSAAVADTTGAQYLYSNGISGRTRASVEEGLAALTDGQIDALVHDAPILEYLIAQQFQGIVAVLPRTFARQDYAIALAQGSELREPVNQHLERVIASPEWSSLISRYLGSRE